MTKAEKFVFGVRIMERMFTRRGGLNKDKLYEGLKGDFKWDIYNYVWGMAVIKERQYLRCDVIHNVYKIVWEYAHDRGKFNMDFIMQQEAIIDKALNDRIKNSK